MRVKVRDSIGRGGCVDVREPVSCGEGSAEMGKQRRPGVASAFEAPEQPAPAPESESENEFASTPVQPMPYFYETPNLAWKALQDSFAGRTTLTFVWLEPASYMSFS